MKCISTALLGSVFVVLIMCSLLSCSLSDEVSGGGATEVGNPEFAMVEGVLLNLDGSPASFMPFTISQKDPIELPTLLKSAIAGENDSESGRSSIIDTTNVDGSFQVLNLISGSYILTSIPDSNTLPIRLEFSLNAQESKTLAPVAPQQPGMLSVTFTSEIHTFQLVTIRIYSPEQVFTHLFKESETLFETPLTPGAYFIRFIIPEKDGDDHLFINRSITIISGESNEFSISIDGN